MRLKSAVVILGALALGVAAGEGASIAYGDPSNGSAVSHHPYHTNRGGQTYGSGLGATSDSQLPDLVQAYATNGQLGYVRAAELAGPNLTLSQVGALPTNSAGQLAEPSRTIPVYEADGTTVIGQFVIQ